MDNKQIILDTLKRNGKFFAKIEVSRSGMSAKLTIMNDKGFLLCENYKIRGCGFNRLVAYFDNFVSGDLANKAYCSTCTL